ncbi:MAG TPA: HAMP domain-containing histidine kinase [Clostridiaceae bacterium]|nr:HAMP domain-containing histidine kinase [Clostridiaceae bacterium]
MMRIIKVFGCYLKRNTLNIFVILVSFGIFMAVFSLYSLPVEAVVYAALLTVFFILVASIIDFSIYYRKHMILTRLRKSITVSDFMFPASRDLIEKDYQELIKIIDKDRMEIINEKDMAYIDMLEYYTVWAHQIKTPIAAMRLVLQSEQSGINNELLEQLFRVEQYVEMVLQYLRTENMSADLMIKRYSLDSIVKQAVRKYSKSFIYKKIKLNYKNLNYNALTDEKWLTFVIEQILSNALKYTNEGEISIYMDDELPDTLVIEDTGIGIEPEDLPRVFEKGFTGYIGRMDKKSTGIGLYLCKRILSKLSHTIKIESTPGKGTKVKIGFATAEIAAD